MDQTIMQLGTFNHWSASSNHLKDTKIMFAVVLFVAFFYTSVHRIDAISTYWTPIIPSFCSPKVSPNITQALLNCDQLMDKHLANIFDDCVRSVFRLKNEMLVRPKLCYYARSGNQLDQCKMARYRAEGITLTNLVDREQEHTWCLMKIAEPLKWERLCSDSPADIAFNMARMSSIQNCETRYQVVTQPIKECYNEQLATKSNQALAWSENGINNPGSPLKPAACLSFQYSRVIWKCLARKESNINLQRASSAYIACLRAIRNSKTSPLMKPLTTQMMG